MAKTLGKPEPGTHRDLTSTELEVAGLQVRSGWLVVVGRDSVTRLSREASAAASAIKQYPDGMAKEVLRLEDYWRAKEKPKPPPGVSLCRVCQEHPMSERRCRCGASPRRQREGRGCAVCAGGKPHRRDCSKSCSCKGGG